MKLMFNINMEMINLSNYGVISGHNLEWGRIISLLLTKHKIKYLNIKGFLKNEKVLKSWKGRVLLSKTQNPEIRRKKAEKLDNTKT